MLDIEKLDPFVFNVLKKSGWYKGRKYDISNYLTILSKDGYVCFEYAEDILESLGGIHISHQGDEEHRGATFDFDPASVALGYFKLTSEFEGAVQEELYPIGEMVQAIAYVGKSKNVYWGDWRGLNWIGNSIENYLNNMFNKKIQSKLLWENPEAEELKRKFDEITENFMRKHNTDVE